MRSRSALLLSTLVLVQPLAASADPVRPARAAAGPFAVAAADLDWHDARRGRTLPVRLHLPQGPGPFPVVLVSHGLGGTRQSLEGLARHWASHGYAVVHLQHPGSDEAAVTALGGRREDALRQIGTDPAAGGHRPLDARFAIDELERLAAAGGPYAGRLDLGRVGIAGTAFGSWTALAVAGQIVVARDGRHVTFADRRVKAAVALSPPPAPRGAEPGVVYGSIEVPVLHVTSARDDNPVAGIRAADRRRAFDHVTGAEQLLLLFAKADAAAFTGTTVDGADAERAATLAREATTAFWDAYLKGDGEARAWLTDGGLANATGDAGRVEVKRAPAGR